MSDPSWFPITELLAASSGDSLGSASAFGEEFELTLGPLGVEQLHVIAFRGLEQMNALYSFDVLFWVSSHDAGDLAAACLGRRARLGVPTVGGRARTVNGIAAGVELTGVHVDRLVYRLRLTPEVWLLSKTTDTRVFQEMTVPQVIGEVLREHRIQYLFSLAATYAPRRYCLQYEETDLGFVMRLAAEEGIFFCFDHFASEEEARRAGVDHATECLLFGDTRALYTPIAGSPVLRFAGDSGGAMTSLESHVSHFRSAASIEPYAATVRGYDYLQATFGGPDVAEADAAAAVRGVTSATAAARPGAPGELEVYAHHDDYEDIDASAAVARTRLEQLRASAIEGSGITWCRRLLPGRTFRLVDHELAALDQEYTVTRVRHEGTARPSADHPVYRCEFSCVPRDVPFRPARPPRKVHQAVETGLVVGPSGQEIETERHGCVRVQFHWDRRGRHDERSSCWIRVMQAWAGPQYGFSFVPRIGMEVLVSFIGGDVDRPVVIGCMPNPGNSPPMVLPQDKTQSAIRTHTTPGDEGGYNEILFEDKQGGELLALRSERNHEVVVNHDHIVRVGHDQTSRIGGNRHAQVTMNDEAAVVGDRVRTVGGTSAETVAGDARLVFGGARALEIAGNDGERIGGGRTVMVGHHLTTVVGQLGVEGHCASITSGVHRIVAGKEIRLESPRSIRLVCGSSSIVLHPDGIELHAERVTVVGVEAVDTKVGDSEVRIGKAIEILSREIKQRSSGAAVVLDAAARVSPPWVASAKGPDGKERKEGPKTPGVATFKIEVPPGTKGPLTLRIATPTGEIVERETDENFEVRMDGVDDDEFVLVEVRSADRALPHARKEPSPA